VLRDVGVDRDRHHLQPLAYDTSRNCGCYHLFIPAARVSARPQPESLAAVVGMRHFDDPVLFEKTFRPIE